MYNNAPEGRRGTVQDPKRDNDGRVHHRQMVPAVRANHALHLVLDVNENKWTPSHTERYKKHLQNKTRLFPLQVRSPSYSTRRNRSGLRRTVFFRWGLRQSTIRLPPNRSQTHRQPPLPIPPNRDDGLCWSGRTRRTKSVPPTVAGWQVPNGRNPPTNTRTPIAS